MSIGNPSGSAAGKEAHPLMGLAPLMRMALSGTDLKPLGEELVQRAQNDPGDASALLDLAIVLQLTGSPDLALTMQADALQVQQLYHLPATVAPATVRLLAMVTPGELMANTPVEFLVANSDVALDLLYVGEGIPPPASVPTHDLLLIAVGESNHNQPLLAALERMVAAWPCPVLNAPGRIARLSRDGARELLDGLPGVEMPNTVRLDRRGLEAVGRGEQSIAQVVGDGDFPVIVRPVGSHAGRGLVKLDSSASIAAYLTEHPDDDFFVSRYVDYRSPDGQFRKYRIVFVEGRPFAVHMAISDHWMVHYLNAGMAENPAKRDEEARFMANFDRDFAHRHAAALSGIAARVELDYFGIDCAETPDGRLLIFEVDSALVVHDMDPSDVFPYKQPQMKQIFEAFRGMLRRRMTQGMT